MDLSENNRIFLGRLLKCKALHLDDDPIDVYECYDFWDSEDVVQWFNTKQYTLYKRVLKPEWHERFTVPALPYESFCEADYPYAYYNAYPVDGGNRHMLTAMDITGRIVFAQDARGRHVVIKATHKGTEEHRILTFLRNQNLELLRQNCILPVLDLLYYDNACFAVMPRWGRNIKEPIGAQTLRDVLRIMHSALKSLSFLHSHYIIHRDISFANILLNHFGGEQMVTPSEPYNGYWQTRMQQLTQGSLEYALIDFDLAKMLSADVKKEEYMLPAEESYVGSHHPGDTSQGEFEYNPFAYDVGTLGVLLRGSYQHYAMDIPLLAPLLDRLCASDTHRRFTATEALRFVERIITDSTESQLSTIAYPRPGPGMPDMWEGLPAEFQREWAAYREPLSLPLRTRMLRAFVHSEWLPGFIIVRSVRWFFWRLASLPRQSWAQIVG